MSIFSWRSVPEVAKTWFDGGGGSWFERLRFPSSLRKPYSASSGDEHMAGGGGPLLGYDGTTTGISFGRKTDDPVESGCKAWHNKLMLASSQLNSISASTEDEFLAIGERLLGFHQRAGEITSIISDLVNQLGGEKGAAAISGLAGMLDVLKKYLDEAQNQSGQQSLAGILEQLHNVDAPLTGFGQMDRSLKMFSTYTKIESARLGARAVGFDSLAKDVIRLSGEVSGKADTVMLRKNELEAVIRNSLSTVMSIGAEQQNKILSILEKTNQSLDLLANIVNRSILSAGIISTSSSEVTENLGQVVFSLQAHDTVRQQIQHVAEALDELAARLPEPGASGHLLVEAGTLCEIQSAQLRHSSAELLNAVENIILNLQGIAVKEMEMANDTQELLGATGQAGASFLTEMGEDLVKVIGMLAAAAMTNRKLAEVMTTAADTVDGIFCFVGDIETIAYDIKLIALNFLIQAAHLGSEGGGLGVMAEAINRLSEVAREQAAGIALTLSAIKEMTDSLWQGAVADASVMEARIKEMRQGLEEMLATLQQMNGGLTQGLTRANAMVRELSANIDEVTAGITVHQRMAAVLIEAETLLDGIGMEAKAMVPETEWSSAMEKFHAADKRYTMHSERNIHAAVVNAQTPSTGSGQQAILEALPEAASQQPASNSSDLGDNVELF